MVVDSPPHVDENGSLLHLVAGVPVAATPHSELKL
jgi:hypothetical protein